MNRREFLTSLFLLPALSKIFPLADKEIAISELAIGGVVTTPMDSSVLDMLVGGRDCCMSIRREKVASLGKNFFEQLNQGKICVVS